ncbi:MAG: riboflavin synthase [Actinomycetota bacterium]
MFTGIVQTIGVIRTIDGSADGRRLETRANLENLKTGDSVAVNGVCLTTISVSQDSFQADVVAETLRRTNLGHLLAGDRVNLEQPLRADGRLDGHIVQGHVDTVGAVITVEADGDGRMITINVGPRFSRYLVEKGSVTVDGVSLTVAKLTEHGFAAALIPHTLLVTTLGLRKVGDPVNLEFDVLAKYVERLLAERS